MDSPKRDWFKIAVVILLVGIWFQLDKVNTSAAHTADMVDAARVDIRNGFMDVTDALEY